MNAADGKSGAFLVGGKEFFDKIGFNLVVAVDEADIIARSEGETVISSGGLTLVFLMDDGDARVFFCISIGNITGVIGGTVVN